LRQAVRERMVIMAIPTRLGELLAQLNWRVQGWERE
jgi:hypothetical protein